MTTFLFGALCGLSIVSTEKWVRRAFAAARGRDFAAYMVVLRGAQSEDELERNERAWSLYSDYMYKMDLRLWTAFYTVQLVVFLTAIIQICQVEK